MKKICSLVAAGFIAGMFVTAFLKYLPSNSAEWASWVQAVGSIGAIVGTYLVATKQIKAARQHSEEQAAKAVEQRMKALVALAEAARNELDGLKQAAHAMPEAFFPMFWQSGAQNAKAALDSLSSVSLSDLVSVDAITGFAGLRTNLAHAINSAELHLQANDPLLGKTYLTLKSDMANYQGLGGFFFDKIRSGLEGGESLNAVGVTPQ